jgi:LuxR family maltose regulon positive regulatory protein
MNGKTTLLKTKLVPPRQKRYILRRPSIFKKLKPILHYPLILIHSGPGYGKSTTLSSFLQDEKLAFCWYSISEQDDDIIPFLTYFINAIRTQYPALGQELLQEIADKEGYFREEELRSIGSELINELHSLPEDVILVLDDFHIIEHSEFIQQWMQWFIQHLPNGFHLVISSRTRPEWEMLSSLKLKEAVLELTERDLAFTEEEIEVLFNDHYEFPLDETQVNLIYRKTEGWAIAIQLIWQQLKAKGDLHTVLHNEAESMDDLFRFLAMELFMKQTPKVQQFLEQSSILDELTGTLCDEILEKSDSSSILEGLSNKNMFLVSLGDKQYRYHALFKDFLTQQLIRKQDQYTSLHSKAALYFREKGRNEQAITHFLAIGDTESLADILQSHGRKMIENGQMESLLDRIKAIPFATRERYYMLWVYEADIFRYRSMYDQAFTFYMKAEKLARDAADAYGESAGLEGQARIYLDTIQPGKADELLKRSIEVLEQAEAPTVENRVRLYSLMAENLVNLGHATDAWTWYEKCRQMKPEFQWVELEARLHLRTGRLMEARKLLERTKKLESRNWREHLPRAHRETDILLSLVYSFIGEPDRAKKYAEASIMQGVQCKAPFVEACGWIRMGHSVQMLPKYTVEMSVDCYKTSLEMMEDIHVPRGKAEPLMGLCLLYGREKVPDLALQYGEQALNETEKVKDLWLSTWIRLGMGIAWLNDRRWEQAHQTFAECYESFETCGDQYGRTVILLWKSMCDFQREDWSSFTDHMDSFLHAVREGGYEFIIQRRTMFGPRDVQQISPLLYEAHNRNILASYVSHLLTEMGMDHRTSHPGYTLRVQTLGGFRVWLGETEMEERDWQRGKAKELFQLLVTKRNKMVPREEILPLLWPELDEEAATRDFKVALNALNKALEPQRTARSIPFFITRHESSYGMNESAGIELDAAEFEGLIHDGLEEKSDEVAREWLQRGLEHYSGDYLPDGRYEDWCIEERERLQVLFLRGAERLAQLYVNAMQYDQGILWCEEILKKDPCWEEAYRIMMMCYYSKNNRSQALKCYHKCRERLEMDLGILPMPRTEQLHQMIFRDKLS